MKNFIFESFYSGMIKQSILHMCKNFCGVRVYSGGWGNSKKIQGLKKFVENWKNSLDTLDWMGCT